MTQVTRKFWPHDLVAGESINVRPGDEEVGDLLASIPVRGLLQALIGRTREDGTVEIIDGNRRLKALKQLFDDGRYQEEVEVHLRDGESDADAFEISLAANVLRRQLHPVAEFEAFVALIEKGQQKQDVADHFGIPLRAVEQRLALGRLHEDVRKAWIEGRINGEAARAFTLASPTDQAAYLLKVTYPHELRADTIRRAFTKETVAASSGLARFVGAEAYLLAGGAFVPDLFAEEPDFADGQLVNALADQKLAAQAETLREAEGWGEVLFGEAATDKYRWHRIAKPALADDAKPARAIEIEKRLLDLAEHRDKLTDALLETEDDRRLEEIEHDRDVLCDEEDRLEEELEQLTESQAWMTLPVEQRAKAIAVLDIDREGKLTIARGFQKDHKPKTAQKPTSLAAPTPKASASGEERPEPAQLSAALLDGLALTATRAAAHVVAAEPRLALAIFVASFATLGSPVRFRSEGRSEGPGLPWSGRDYRSETTFVDVLKSTMMLSIDELQLHTAKCVAHMLDFTSKAITSNSMDALKPQAAQAVRAALPFADHRAALVQAFDPAEYFSAAPKQEAIAAIADCGDEPAKYAKLKKADLGAAATRLATARGWLPARLRGDVFDAVLPAEETDAEEGDKKRDEPGEPETPASAAEAALEIWLGQERTRLVAMKAPELRELLKTRGVTIPFASTKMQLIELALQHGDPDSSIEEAA